MGVAQWAGDRWDELTGVRSGAWLALAAWLAVLLAVAAWLYAHRQIRRVHALNAAQAQPNVVMFMEPNAADWHVIELVVKNYGRTPAYDVTLHFDNPPTVVAYEDTYEGRQSEVVAVQLPDVIPVLAPGQEWRTVWDSAIDREQVGTAVASRFEGTVQFFDRPGSARRRKSLRSEVVLDWAALQPVQRLELLTGHEHAKREKQKLEMLRSLLTYFHYAAQETRPEVLRREIDKVNRSVEEIQDRWRRHRLDDATDVHAVVNGNGSARHRRPAQSGRRNKVGAL
ncbi:hypothetical protein LV457_06480 [Mycobacterium sp. MYCO198283]|uniref:hypothetical protein n=1 Tax=Mycobacterium sp. MYCO198283 TaxID=2883505 RepID=UPI001E3BF83D|nr:hypothetical protein [Mycobacterium sp. MYCO198283]MCG5431935.1 hypothetical protein [Mycobacterium sp. MYCO198283]